MPWETAAALEVLDGVEVVKDKRGNRGGAKKKAVINSPLAFDIETSVIDTDRGKQAIMYIWMLAIDEQTIIIGRTWDEFKKVAQELHKYAKRRKADLVIYVHNLSYEFQFLQGIYKFGSEDVFALKPHKILKCTMAGNLEFRCSYLHSNMSLAKFAEKMDVPHKKAVGSLDYEKTRYPWTYLNPSELRYCYNDVFGLVECVKKEMTMDGDTLLSIPLTSTGYVRRDVKKSMQNYPHGKLVDTLPDYECFCLLLEEFRGGDTHANRRFSGKILENVKSDDRSSSYPAEQNESLFPVGKWHKGEPEKATKIINDKNVASVFRVRFYGLKMSAETFPDPLLSLSKTRNAKGYILDNGRILSADFCETTLNDVDYSCYKIAYKWSRMEVTDIYFCAYGKLPEEMREPSRRFYRTKTEKKGMPEEEYYYFKDKNKLNSIYGMTAQNPIREAVTYDPENYDFNCEMENPEEQYKKSLKKAFLSYAWACWTTAHARKQLFKGILIAYRQGFAVYWDTDSVKYLGDVDFTNYNNSIITKAEKVGAYADDRKGKRHYMGVYEYEGNYTRFKTLGAKKYAYEDADGLHVTIAGVNKAKGAAELEKAGGLEAFEEGFIFSDAGGTEIKYNNDTFDIQAEGRPLKITPNAAILPSTYQVGITGDYKRILQGYVDLVDFA